MIARHGPMVRLETTSYGWPLCPCHKEPMTAVPGDLWQCWEFHRLSSLMAAAVARQLTKQLERSA